MEILKIVLGFLLGVILGFVGGYFSANIFSQQAVDIPVSPEATKEMPQAVPEEAVNPFEGIITNPLEEVVVNPYQDIKVNPFQ